MAKRRRDRLASDKYQINVKRPTQKKNLYWAYGLCFFTFLILGIIACNIIFSQIPKKSNSFVLNGESIVYVDVNGEFNDPKATLIIADKDKSNLVIIDDKDLNLNSLGTYYIYYSTNQSTFSDVTLIRTVIVRGGE